MRYVDVEVLRLPNGWLDEAEAATRAAMQEGALPAAHDDIWRDLKAKLAELLYEKCWFCETPITRSDNAVDHFRPKGRVGDAERQHLGYRWLAFERGNFRYACTFCNSRRVDVEHGTSGGKADRFPLLNEAARVYAVDAATLDFNDLLKTVRGERPAILDPCSLDDGKLLGCMRENGQPCPASENEIAINRVETSINVYHLDHEPTCKQRHLVAITLLDTVRDAKAAFLKIDVNNPDSEAEFAGVAKRIRRMIDRTAPYSGEMMFLLRGQRATKHPWIQQLLDV